MCELNVRQYKMRLHTLYASIFVLCFCLYLMSLEHIRYSSLHVYESVAWVSGIIAFLTILGPNILFLVGKYIWFILRDYVFAFLRALPLPRWMNLWLVITTVLVLTVIAVVCELVGYKNTSNDWVEIPLRIGGVGICCIGILYILVAKIGKCIPSKL